MTESHAREEICRVGKSLFDRGYAHATAGNISDSPATAMAVLEELEESARLVLLAPGPCPSLTAIQIEELRLTFGARW